MTFAFTQDVPIDTAFHDRIRDALGAEKPAGLIVHVAMALPAGGLRYLDIWETEEDCERFTEERLHPVVHAMLAEIFGDELPPEPERTPVSVAHVWQ
jgi:hypothetical protein